jgi:hypothetical protein
MMHAVCGTSRSATTEQYNAKKRRVICPGLYREFRQAEKE